MPGCRTWVVLLRTSLLFDCTVMPAVLSGSMVISGSATLVPPVVGAGVIVNGPRLYVPTMVIVLPLAIVTVAELPFVPSAPPFAAVHAESTITEPSKVTVGPPEMSMAGQPLRPFGQPEFDGSRSTTE